MTWRIQSIAVYSKTGQVRELGPFRSGLNVITGVSARGKSALLDIVDYCLMSDRCRIPKGVIREKVSHVGLLIAKPNERMAIVRSLPPEGQKTSEACYLERGPNVVMPQKIPEPRWNSKGAKEQISEFTGISAMPILTNFGSADPEEKHAANIRHTLPYLYQPQDVIASRTVSFVGVQDSFQRRHYADAAAYFLGILTPEDLARRRELRELTLDRNRLQRRLDEQRRLRIQGLENGRRLWNDAIALGLISAAPEPESEAELVRQLKVATGRDSKLPAVSDSPDLASFQAEEAYFIIVPKRLFWS